MSFGGIVICTKWSVGGSTVSFCRNFDKCGKPYVSFFSVFDSYQFNSVNSTNSLSKYSIRFTVTVGQRVIKHRTLILNEFLRLQAMQSNSFCTTFTAIMKKAQFSFKGFAIKIKWIIILPFACSTDFALCADC